MKPIQKSSLLKTSTANDVVVSGGIISVTGLNAVRQLSLIDFKQIIAKTEVVQVYTAGGGSYTPTAATTYTVSIGDPNATRQGYTGTVLRYSYTTPALLTSIGATAALQREFIHAALIVEINNDIRNNVAALTSGTGTGFTITDDAGYYPANINGGDGGRKGASFVQLDSNPDGSGWSATNLTLTTAAIYSFGQGTRMAQDQPILAAYTQNLASGDLNVLVAPAASDGTYAVSGQKYNAFSITSLSRAAANSIIGEQATIPMQQIVFVDNGLGSATTNAAGYIAFEREMPRALFGQYANDPTAIVEFFDNGLIASATYPTTGALISTTDNVVMAVSTGKNVLYVNPQSTHTLLTPIISANSTTSTAGLQLLLDVTDEEGMELSTPNVTNCPKQFVVGKQEFSVYARITAADFRHLEEFSVGFRKKTNTAVTLAYAATLAAYDAAGNDFAVLGNGTEAVTGLQRIMTSLASGGVVSTSTAVTYTTNTTHDFEVRVDINGLCHFYLDGVDKTSLQATQFSFAAGAVVIPFIITALDANVDAAPLLTQLAAIPSISWRM